MSEFLSESGSGRGRRRGLFSGNSGIGRLQGRMRHCFPKRSRGNPAGSREPNRSGGVDPVPWIVTGSGISAGHQVSTAVSVLDTAPILKLMLGFDQAPFGENSKGLKVVAYIKKRNP